VASKTEVEQSKTRTPILRKAAAVAILVVAAMIAIQIASHVVAAVFWVVVAVAAVVIVAWALITVRK
jgi:uncharacterized membrane protein